MNNTLVIETKNFRRSFLVKDGEELNLETVSVFEKPGDEGKVQIKVVVMDKGKLNLKGIIKIKKNGVGVNAFLKQEVLVVGEGAAVIAEPQLEIETNEVKASHAASVGQIDEEQLFYLTSKGFGRDESVKMIIEAFLNE